MVRCNVTAAFLMLCGIAAAQTATTQPTVQIKEIIPGQPKAQDGDTLFVIYTGKLENGTVFDTNVDGRLFQFVLGSGQVIKGWDDGLRGMEVGEKRQLTVPPDLAYGSAGHGRVPANATLIFDVQLVGLVRTSK